MSAGRDHVDTGARRTDPQRGHQQEWIFGILGWFPAGCHGNISVHGTLSGARVSPASLCVSPAGVAPRPAHLTRCPRERTGTCPNKRDILTQWLI